MNEKNAGRKKAAAYRPLVYICSPYSHGCINDNIENARRYSRFAVDTHYVPIAPHLLFPQFMDDSLGEDRQTAMFMNLVLLSKVCPAVGVWFCAVGGYAAGNQMGEATAYDHSVFYRRTGGNRVMYQFPQMLQKIDGVPSNVPQKNYTKRTG